MTVEAPPRPRVGVPATPYVGLTPFTESDAPFFFGREKERRIISANLLASRLTLLYGASGVGKSSIIRAGVQRDFRARAEKALASGLFPESIVVVFTGWRDDPVTGLAECVEATVKELLGKLAPPAPRKKLTLDDLLVEWNRRLDERALDHAGAAADLDEPIRTELLVIFDQFEQYFVYHGDEDGPDTFAVQFPQAVNRDDLRASFLISLREDAYTQLDRFEGRILNLFASNLRVEHLDEKAATAAIVKPVETYNELLGNGDPPFEVEPELVKAVIREVRAGNIVLGQAGGGVVEHDEPEQTRVETPFLQLVMSRLWAEEQRQQSHVLRLETLESLGGAERIVRRHLEEAMSALGEGDRAVAARMLHQLVTPSGARIVHKADDLAGYAGVPLVVAEPILEQLDERRILRTIDPAPGEKTPRFEIRHDVLAGAVVEWGRQYEEQERRAEEEARQRQQVEEERRRQRARLSVRFGVAGSTLALLAVALGLLALVSFLSARDDRDQSHSREIAQTAVGLLPSLDPADSVRKAYEAVKIHDTPEAEEALRSAVVAAHRRAVLTGHRNTVLFARFSPDGKRVVTASADGTARLWETATGTTLAVLRGHADAVNSAAFSPDGRLIVTASSDRTARIWDAASRSTPAVLRGHAGAVNSAAFSPGGRLVVTASSDGTARVWDVRSGRTRAILRGHKQAVNSAAFSPGGARIVTAAADGTARIWTRNGKPLVTLRQGDPVLSAAFSPDGLRIVTTGVDKTARIWDVRTPEHPRILRGHTGFVFGASFSPDGAQVVTASQDGTARVWTVDPPGLVRILRGHGDAVYSAAFSPDGRLIVTASADGTARLWDATDGTALLRSWHGGKADVAFSPKGPLMVIAGPGNAAQVWDAETLRRVGSPLRHPARVTSAAFSPDGKRIVTASEDGSLRIFEATTGRLLAVSSPDCTLFDGRRRCIAAHAASFSPNGKLVLAEGNAIARIRDGDLRLRRKLHATPAPVGLPTFAPNGKVAIVSGGRILLFDPANGRPEATPPQDDVTSASFSPDGKQLITLDTVGNVTVWKAGTSDTVLHLTGRVGAISGPGVDDQVRNVAFSPTGDVIVTTTQFGGARLWESRSGRPLAALRREGKSDSKIVMSHDDRFILTAGPAGTNLYSCEACLPIEDLLRLGHWTKEELRNRGA